MARLNTADARELLYITRQQSGRHFLVDSGTSFSIVPFSSTSTPSGPRLIGPSGSVLCCWGEEKQQLCFAGPSFSWTFLCINFLRHHRLLLDAATYCLLVSHSGVFSLSLSRQHSGPTAAIVLPKPSSPSPPQPPPPTSFPALLL